MVMGDWITRGVILVLLAVIVGLPLAFRAMQPASDATAGEAAADGPRLIILSPHSEQIRFEFTQAFNRWRRERGEPAVLLDWRSSGGTSDLRDQVVAEFTAAAKARREDQGIGKDLFFGGGDFEHDGLARGITIERDGQTVSIPLTEPIRLPEGLLLEAFPSPEIGGLRLYHPKLHWVGATMASFGIVYNRDVLGRLNLPEPRTWTDLETPAYFRMVALGDPSHSGSVGAASNILLRRMGWNEGWAVIRRMSANARYFTASASKVPVDVSAGEAAAGMCIDFYGRFQAGAIGGDRVGYVDPAYMTAVNADPISILRGAPHRALAEQFVTWLLSKPAQRLWQRRIGAPEGPTQFELRRLPVRRDMYTPEERAFWVDRDIDPFGISRPIPQGMPDFFRLVSPVMRAMAIDVHDDLQAAWRRVCAVPEADAARAEWVRRFDAMPPELTLEWPDAELAANWRGMLEDASHPRRAEVVTVLNGFAKGLSQRYSGAEGKDRLLADRLRWTLWFRDNYRSIAAGALSP